MTTGQLTVQGTVTASTATAITVTPSVDTWDRACAGGIITTLVINGTTLTGLGARVGDRITVRLNA
jgi:hypothetical protein